ncbi:MAG TPA: UDP-galactose-lipid carrier transferase [Acidimicrobiales bacterium]|nr:UDP-galactose-lipid carrier transferase [Acidimicrobiales bacterium]
MAGKHHRLAKVDLSLRISPEEAVERLSRAQRRLLHLRLINAGLLGDGRLGPPVCVLFEGWDAAGKGGTIRRLVASLDPRHVRVAEFGPPTPTEARHHFLWRFFPSLPGWGGMAVFDRSWYGRVLVERVEGYATDEQWRRAYQEISAFERSLTDEGMVIVKLWLHMSDDEQLRRFEARRKDPLKRWKLTDDDWRNRGRRTEYEEAVEDMFAETDHDDAPWDVIPAEQKRYGRVAALQQVITRMEDGMRKAGLAVPPSKGVAYG